MKKKKLQDFQQRALEKYPEEFDERYEFVNETQRELEFIKDNLNKKQQQMYLAELTTDRRGHLKTQIVSNMGMER